MYDRFGLNIVENLAQRHHDKLTLPHARMGNDQVGLVDTEVVVQQDVDIDDAIVILPIGSLHRASHLALNVLCDGQQLARRLGCKATHAGVNKLIGRREAPRLRLQQRRLPLHLAHSLVEQGDGLTNQAFAVADVGADAEINVMQHSQKFKIHRKRRAP